MNIKDIKIFSQNVRKKNLIVNTILKTQLLQIKDFRVSQRKEPCIGFIQKNLIENSIQDCLSYILNYNGSCYYFSSLS